MSTHFVNSSIVVSSPIRFFASFIACIVLSFGIFNSKGISQISKDTGLGRESLYKTFKKGSKPRFDTVLKVLNSFDIKLKAIT